jgi:hypothetical protein
LADPTHPRKLCENCGVENDPKNTFCGLCGAPMASPGGHDSADRSHDGASGPGKRSSPLGELSLDRLRLLSADPTREALLGGLLVVGVALVQIVGFYVLLLLRWAVGAGDAPGIGGLVGFVAAHGGALFVELPPVPELLGIGGSLKIDPPITTIALLPFVLLLAGSWVLSRRERASVVFALVATVCYALILAVLALLFRTTSSGGEGAEITVSAAPLSAAMHGLLIAGLGTLIGVVAARGPFLPDRARQVLRGGLVAVGASVILTVLLSMLVLAQTAIPENPLEDLRQDGGPQPGEKAQPDGSQADAGGARQAVSAVAGAIGGAFALLPAGVGTLWLLAHGLPVGLQNAPDLSGVPLIGEALKDVKLSASLIGNWPFAGAWRLLLLAPVVGLVLGGAVAAHGAPPSYRWRYGALIAIPYTAIVLLTAILASLSVSLSVAALELDLAFRASLAWALLVFPVAAGLGAAGALLARQGSMPAPHPQWVGIITAGACGLLLLGTSPLVAASSSDVPAPEEALASGSGPKDKSSVPLPDLEESPPAPEKIPKPDFSPPQQPEKPDAPQSVSAPAQQRFVEVYYAAVARDDWGATYSLLDRASQSKVTRDEWIRGQQAREYANDKPPVQSAQITQMSREPGSFSLTIELTHEDGTKTTVTGFKVQSVGGSFRRHLTREELIDGAPL